MGNLNPNFEGETVVVTGGTSGIGREVALRFAEAGAAVVVGDVDREPKDAAIPTAALIEDAGGTAAFVRTDVAEYGDLEALVGAAREYGGVDVMVNNAATMAPESLVVDDKRAVRSLTPEEFDHIFAVNARGCFFGIQVAAADMLDRDDPGVILNTASISTTRAQRGQVHYDATKGAVGMMTRGAALELAEDAIRVNGVAPGQTATEFVEDWSEVAYDMVEAGDLAKPVPLGRPGTPADVAGAYLFLASEDAAYVTGELLYVDGGWQVF